MTTSSSSARKLRKIVPDREGMSTFRYSEGDRKRSATYTWFRGEHCSFGPSSASLQHWTGYQEHFLKGFVPAAPLINPSTRITAFGSCFAANISAFLARRNYNVLTGHSQETSAYIIRVGEGFVNTYAIRQQFEWAFEGKQPSVELWHGYDGAAFGYDDDARKQTRAIFANTDIFVLTLGLSEVWFDRPTGEVFWRAIPKEKYDPERHGFRTVSTEQNYENLREIVRIIQANRPTARIIFSLSPIPLVATFRPMAAPTANSVSKASLRCAIDRLILESDRDRVFYWPSYEIVLDGFLRKWEPDLRHVKPQILTFIMHLFERHWCGISNDGELADVFLSAKVADGSLSKRLLTLSGLERETLIRKLKKQNRQELARLLSEVRDTVPR